MAEVTVYNRSGRVSGTIETDEYIFTQFPGDSGISTRTYSCDKDVFPYVKVYDSSGLKYYRNDGDEWTYTNANQSAKLMRKIDGFRIPLTDWQYSNFTQKVSWNKISSDQATSNIKGSGEAFWTSLGHYYVKDSNGLQQASYSVYPHGVKTGGLYVFANSQDFAPGLYSKDLARFGMGGHPSNSTTDYYYEVLYDDFGSNTDGKTIVVNVKEDRVVIETKINNTTESKKTFYKTKKETVLLIERQSASWSVNSPSWPSKTSDKTEVNNVIPMYDTYVDWDPKSPHEYPTIYSAAKLNWKNKPKSYRHSMYPHNQGGEFRIVGTSRQAALMYKELSNESLSFSNKATADVYKYLSSDFPEFCKSLSAPATSHKEYSILLPAISFPNVLTKQEANDIWVGIRYSNATVRGVIEFPWFHTTIWSKEEEMFDKDYQRECGNELEHIQETNCDNVGSKDDPFYISTVRNVVKISDLPNGLIDLVGWQFNVKGDMNSEDNKNRNYNVGEALWNYKNKQITSFDWLTGSCWASFSSIGYLNSSPTTTYAHSIILYRGKY